MHIFCSGPFPFRRTSGTPLSCTLLLLLTLGLLGSAPAAMAAPSGEAPAPATSSAAPGKATTNVSPDATANTSPKAPAKAPAETSPKDPADAPADTPEATPAAETAAPELSPEALALLQKERQIEEAIRLRQDAMRLMDEDAKARAEEKARAEAEEKARIEAEAQAKREAAARAEQLRQEAEKARLQAERNAENALWDQAFKQRQAELNAVEIDVESLSRSVNSIIWPLRQALPPLQEAARQLFSLATSHKNSPMMLEAIDRRGIMLASDLRRQMQPLHTTLNMVETLTMALTQLRQSLPDVEAAPTQAGPALSTMDTQGNALLITPEQMEARERVLSMESQLAVVKKKLDDALEPAQTLLTPLATMQTSIAKYLPGLWQSYYLDMPSRFFDPAIWQNSAERWRKTINNMELRLSIEVPRTLQDWEGLGLRFLNVFVLGSLVTLFVRSRIGKSADEEMRRERPRMLRSLCRMVVGIALLSASVGSDGEMLRVFMILGSLLIIGGEMALAWSLRCVTLRRETSVTPLWPLFVSTTLGTALSYPDLPEGILSLSWILASALMLYLLQSKKDTLRDAPQLEGNLVLVHRITLLLSLGVAIFGWARMSILLLITINCLVVSTQLVWGLLQLINRSADADDNAQKGMTAGIVAACTAPAVLVLVVISTTLWVIALPGGAMLLWYYLKSGVQVGEASFDMVSLLFIVSGFYLTRAAITTAQSFLGRLASRSQRLDKSLIPPMQTGITYGLWSLFGLFTLNAIGFGLANLAVIAGGLSVGIGFGLQTIVNNFLSGLILIFSRTLHEGDVVDVAGLLGTVRKISVRATTVETFDNALIFVPNSEFVSNRLINWTRNGRSVRRNLMVGVAYGTDPELVERLLLQVARENQQVQNYPAPMVVFTDFAASTLNFTLRYWSDISNDPLVGSRMRFDIVRLFAEHGVQIAFPQLDIHLVSSGPEASAALASALPQAPVVPAPSSAPSSAPAEADK